MVGGQISSTQVKHSPPTSVQVTQLPFTNRTLYLDFPDLCLSFRMCVPLSWSNARSIWLLLSTFIFSPSTISFAMVPIFLFTGCLLRITASLGPGSYPRSTGPLSPSGILLAISLEYILVFFCAFCSISTFQFSLSNINKFFQYFQI